MKFSKGDEVKVTGGEYAGERAWFHSYCRKPGAENYALIYFRRPNVQGALIALENLDPDEGQASEDESSREQQETMDLASNLENEALNLVELELDRGSFLGVPESLKETARVIREQARRGEYSRIWYGNAVLKQVRNRRKAKEAERNAEAVKEDEDPARQAQHTAEALERESEMLEAIGLTGGLFSGRLAELRSMAARLRAGEHSLQLDALIFLHNTRRMRAQHTE